MTTQEFESALATFVEKLNENQRSTEGPNFPENCRETIQAQPGRKKYVRIVRVRQGDSLGSCYCFVEVETGNILKSAGYKGPAKGARGSIYTTEVKADGYSFAGRLYR